jgi:hypothetical protein
MVWRVAALPGHSLCAIRAHLPPLTRSPARGGRPAPAQAPSSASTPKSSGVLQRRERAGRRGHQEASADHSAAGSGRLRPKSTCLRSCTQGRVCRLAPRSEQRRAPLAQRGARLQPSSACPLSPLPRRRRLEIPASRAGYSRLIMASWIDAVRSVASEPRCVRRSAAVLPYGEHLRTQIGSRSSFGRYQSACLRRKAGISISSIPLLASASTFAAAVRPLRQTLGVVSAL